MERILAKTLTLRLALEITHIEWDSGTWSHIGKMLVRTAGVDWVQMEW